MAAMYDFESVSVSSYEAASLAATLAEKSADGWDVVAIVPAGSDVIAYLRRSATTDQATDDSTDQVTDGTSNTLEIAASDDSSTAADAADADLDEQRAGGDVRRHHDADRFAGVDRVERHGLGSRHRFRRRCRRLDQWLGVRRLVIVVVGWIVATGGSNALDSRRSRRVVRGSGRSLRVALLGWFGVDRARLAGRPAVHRPARRLNPSMRRVMAPRHRPR